MENNEKVPVLPTVPPTPLVAQKTWYQHKGLIWIFALAVIAALSIWLYYLNQPPQNFAPAAIQYLHKSQVASTTPISATSSAQSNIDTSNWQTYNSNLGISIQYPDNWFATSSAIAPYAQFSNYQTPPPFSQQTLQSVSQFTLSLAATGKNLSLNRWFQSQNLSNNSTAQVPATVANYPAIKIQIPQQIGDEWTYYYVAVGSNIYEIGYIDAAPQSEPSQFLGIYQGMINSISFSLQFQPSSTVFNQLNDKYNLFVPVPGSDCDGLPTIQYYDEGMVTAGDYNGYHRVIAAVQACDPPGGNNPYVFATKDYQTFIADGNPSDYENAKKSSPAKNNYEVDFNYDNVINFANLPNDNPPASIQLGNFVLVQNDYWYGIAPTSSPLADQVSGFTIYADPGQTYTGGWNPDNTYLGSDDDILVKTTSGQIFDYLLISQEEFSNSSGTPASLDGVFYSKNQISSSASLYNTYGQIVPGACGGLTTTYVINNISQNDLTQIGTTKNGVVLYKLKNSKHSLYNDEYKTKSDTFSGTFADYVAKNPVLIFQDPWSRWIGLGEFDNSTEGGCGKPVIYLYPTKTMQVTVKFLNPMRFSLDIPTYVKEWDVLANSDGELKDLQPQLTDCSKINYNLLGSEYAEESCPKGIYPYLYWEGQTADQYPNAQGGWIVRKNDLATFLNSKLTEIGLNDKERTDMVSYWVPQLLAKNEPYYRLSFFQTQAMDDFIPMQVIPKPDTTIRVFLDWSPLASLPTSPLPPQILYHTDRKGFTLVEWGGLK